LCRLVTIDILRRLGHWLCRGSCLARPAAREADTSASRNLLLPYVFVAGRREIAPDLERGAGHGGDLLQVNGDGQCVAPVGGERNRAPVGRRQIGEPGNLVEADSVEGVGDAKRRRVDRRLVLQRLRPYSPS